MRTLLRILLLFALCGEVMAAERHVLIISIDGLPAYLLDDPKASLPTIRGLIARGAVAEGGMVVSNPAVTWPNHTTLMTGVRPESHGVIFNGVVERSGPDVPVRNNPAKPQRELVRVPLLFDILKAAGRTSAAINWPCTRESESIDDNMPDVPNALAHTTPRLREALSDEGLLRNFDDGGGVVRDHVWSEAACRLIRERMPDLLAVHLLNLDGTHHRYGPRTAPGYTAAALADAQVGHILRTVEQAGHAGTTTVLVVSDHGFIQAPRSVRANVILRKAGWLEADDRGRVVKARAHVLSEGGIGMLYFTDRSTPAADRLAVKRLFDGVEGVSAVLGPEEYRRYGFPSPDQHAGMADLVIACREGYSIGVSAAGDEQVVEQDGSVGVHGYLSTEPKMRAVFVAYGAGIRPGVRLGTIENVDVAPTIARILGVELPGTSGRALEKILLESGRSAAAAGSAH